MTSRDAGGIASHQEITAQPAGGNTAGAGRLRPEGWWRLTDIRVGIIPLPIFASLILLVGALVHTGEIKSDGTTMIAVLVLGGFM